MSVTEQPPAHPSPPAATGPLDPITFEVIRSGFVAICNEMALVLAKTAYSMAVNEGQDFAATMYDAEGRLVAQSDFDLAGFVGIAQLAVPEVVRQLGRDTLADGDIYMINDPYVASSHTNDVHLIKPVFVDGELLGFVATTAHWGDVGGVAPGTLNARARSAFEEGVRIPAVRLHAAGTLNRDVVNLLLVNTREAWERTGDLNAQVAAVRAGEVRIRAMCAKNGVEVVRSCMAEVQDYSERLLRVHLAGVPDGVYEAEDFVDQDLYTGEPKAIRVRLVVDDGNVTVDLTESDDAALSGINTTIGVTLSAVFIAFAAVLPPVPMNAGIRRVIEIKVREGSLLWAQPPMPVSGSIPTTMDCLMATLEQCLSKAMPERGVAAPFSILSWVFSGIDGRPDFDAGYLTYIWSLGGLGATHRFDGPSVSGSAYVTTIQIIPCEVQERRFPFFWWRQRFLQDSGGAGARRGGLGCDQIVEMLQSGTVSCVGNRERFGPPGIFGGDEGATSQLLLEPGTDREVNAGVTAVGVQLEPGTRLQFNSSGGGGFGDPLERDPAHVLDDVLDEYISIEMARERYGVVIAEVDRRALRLEIDEAATAELRAQATT